MEFAHEAHKKAYERVQPMLKELFGEMVIAHPEFPAFGIRMGSAVANIAIVPWRDDSATINVRAWVVMGAELKPDLLKFLLNKNNSVIFGGFGIDEQGDIFFQHTIVAASVDLPELRAAVLAVVSTADDLDDEIVKGWGGRRALDHKS